MQRHNFQHDGLNLSYLDTGGVDETLVALHSHWMEGQTFDSLAAALAPGWRVIALDQRGHGYSDHASTYTREEVAALVEGELIAFAQDRLASYKCPKRVITLDKLPRNAMGKIQRNALTDSAKS